MRLVARFFRLVAVVVFMVGAAVFGFAVWLELH